MTIIIGLGNPGKKYIRTRHNIGFMVIDQIAKEKSFPEFKLSKKFNSLISENNGIILAKPQTFMNLSGQTVKLLISYYKDFNLIVVHDDIDLLLGKIKIARNRGSAGHKGVDSIIKEIGQDFTRVRIGVQPLEGKPESLDKFVVKKFSPKDSLEKIIKESVKAVEKII